MTKNDGTVRLAAVADLHYGRTSTGSLQWLSAAAERAEILLVCGDLTDHGLAEEARALARELNSLVKIPIVSVLGNHDFEAAQVGEVAKILSDQGIRVLDGDACEVRGIGFAGVKGFAGGFGARILKPWGEATIKALVREGVEEALKLESALARLKTNHRVALLHYAPIQDTVEGEPPEIFPFLGCSRLEEPINRYSVNVVFHGHAHHGRPAGRTSSGVPVYNVSHALLQRSFPDRLPAHFHELQADEAASSQPAAQRFMAGGATSQSTDQQK
jgi:Icc-related predicted phosphoesterase